MVGDPKVLLHPVEVMGYLIDVLRNIIESNANSKKSLLRIGGILLTLCVVIVSGLSGWLLEQFFITNYLSIPIIIPFIILVVKI